MHNNIDETRKVGLNKDIFNLNENNITYKSQASSHVSNENKKDQNEISWLSRAHSRLRSTHNWSFSQDCVAKSSSTGLNRPIRADHQSIQTPKNWRILKHSNSLRCNSTVCLTRMDGSSWLIRSKRDIVVQHFNIRGWFMSWILNKVQKVPKWNLLESLICLSDPEKI